MNRVHLSGLGESRDATGALCWWVSTWRYGKAIEGEPAHVSAVEWFDSRDAFIARRDQFFAEEPTP